MISSPKWNDVIAYMHRPVDAASLGVCRMLFGFVMLIDIPEERGGAALFEKWDNAKLCHFPIISTITSMDATKMGVVYAIMWIGAFGIFVGYKFRWSAIIFSSTYWYVFLVDRSVWNNHSYLYGLCGVLFVFSSADQYCSIDAWRKQSVDHQTVPFWNYFILKFQFVVLYFMAGLKKLSTEWLSGYAMTNLSAHWVFAPFRLVFGMTLTDLLIVHWFTCFFDLTIAFWIMYRPTRPCATIFCVAFHLMNTNLFSIGMFPWLCLTQLPLFFERNWPRMWLHYLCNITNADEPNLKRNRKSSSGRTMTTILILMYCTAQAILPYSHFLTPGYNTWTDGPYGYSWDMMVHAWDTVRVSVKVRDNQSGREHFLNHNEFVYTDRWSKHADMAHQFAQCLAKKLREDIHNPQGPSTSRPLTSNDISIYFDVWCSLNGRFQQRIFDPNIDILNAVWNGRVRTPWVLPLISNMATDRARMQAISKTIHAQHNHSDILFVADFPGLSVEHAVPDELANVTLTVLQGAVDVTKDGGKEVSIHSGSTITIESGFVYEIYTIGTAPSGTMYTFSNRSGERDLQTTDTPFSLVSYIHKTIDRRCQKYAQFARNIMYSIACEISGLYSKIRY